MRTGLATLLFASLLVSACTAVPAATRPESAPLQAAKAELEHKQVVEMKLFLQRAAYEKLLAALERQNRIEKHETITSWYFDAFTPSTGGFVLQGDGAGKFRFREKRAGQKVKHVLQTKRRLAPSSTPVVAGLPFSLRFSDQHDQELSDKKAKDVLATSETAQDAFVANEVPAAFARHAQKAGAAFLDLKGPFLDAFRAELDRANATAEQVVFAGAMADERHVSAELETPEGDRYEFQLDRFTLAPAPGRHAEEFALEADIAPSASEAQSRERAQRVMKDVARRLSELGLGAGSTVAPKESLSDPLGPNGGYMKPVADQLKKGLSGR